MEAIHPLTIFLHCGYGACHLQGETKNHGADQFSTRQKKKEMSHVKKFFVAHYSIHVSCKEDGMSNTRKAHHH